MQKATVAGRVKAVSLILCICTTVGKHTFAWLAWNRV